MNNKEKHIFLLSSEGSERYWMIYKKKHLDYWGIWLTLIKIFYFPLMRELVLDVLDVLPLNSN